MGVDATLIVRGTVTDEELEKAGAFFADRYQDERPIRVFRDRYVEIDLDGQRYYGPGYERGNWPTIANAILHTRAAFPGHEIAYGGDGNEYEDLPEVTEEMLAENWAHWLGPDWDAYYRRREDV